MRRIAKLLAILLIAFIPKWMHCQIKLIGLYHPDTPIKFPLDESCWTVLSRNNAQYTILAGRIEDSICIVKTENNSIHKIYVGNNAFDLSHSVVEFKNTIYILDKLKKTAFLTHNYTNCKSISLNLEKEEEALQIINDANGVYLVSYNFLSKSLHFRSFIDSSSAFTPIFRFYYPMAELFYSDPYFSNFSFQNQLLRISEPFTGKIYQIQLANLVIDTFDFCLKLNPTYPHLGTYERLNNQYNKSPTTHNYDSLMALTRKYNYIHNIFSINDSILLASIYKSNPGDTQISDYIILNLKTHIIELKQNHLTPIKPTDTVSLSNLPIYIGFEQFNTIGDGGIFIQKTIPQINTINFREYFNALNNPLKTGIPSILIYEYKPKTNY